MNININDIRPRELIKDELIRLGNPKGDGGYAVPLNLMLKTDILYSYGVGDNTSFEEDYIKRTGKPVHGYDHTITFNNNIQLYTYHQEGLSSSPLPSMNNYLNHIKYNGDDKKNVLLKIDVEGAEYEWIANTDIKKVAESATILVIEFHNAHLHLAGSLERIKEHYNIVHWHGNNFGGIINHFPSVPEITFLSKSIEVGDYLSKSYPINGLDVPNNGVEDGYKFTYI